MAKLLFFLSADLDSMYPGVVFYSPPISQHLTSLEATIDRLEDLGVSVLSLKTLSVLRRSLQIYKSDPASLGRFIYQMTTNQQVLPTSFTTTKCISRRTSPSRCFIMPICRVKRIVTTWNSSQPVPLQSTWGSCPVYTFKKPHEANGVFKPGDVVGEISLQHFSYEIIGQKRERTEETSDVSTKKNEVTIIVIIAS